MRLDEHGCRTLANRMGLELVGTHRSPLAESTSFRFRLLSAIGSHTATIDDVDLVRDIATLGPFMAMLTGVRAAMRLDALRALLDDDEPLDLLASGMSRDDAFELLERVSVRLAETAVAIRTAT